MTLHSHRFVEEYRGLVGFGLNRETDENTLICYLQKFSDDKLINVMRQRLSDQELEDVFNLLAGLLHRHLSEDEYHGLFLKEQD